MTTTLHYPTPQVNSPQATFRWLDSQGNVIDFSSGYTFRLSLSQPPNAAKLVKTSGIAGFNPSTPTGPNLVVGWSGGELSVLSPGRWTMQITAVKVSNGSSRTMTGVLVIDSGAY